MVSHSAPATPEKIKSWTDDDMDRRFTGRSTLPRSSSSSSRLGTPDSAGSNSTDEDAADGDSVNVVIRVRPMNERETEKNDTLAVQFPGDGQIWVEGYGVDPKIKPFSFNVVFEERATQEDVMKHSGMTTLIDMAMDGYSATVFCYGQTGSGKTHTLTGPPGLIQSNNFESEDHGLMFRSFVYLFGRLEKADPELNYVIRASYLEIYNEQVKDLLNPNPNQRSLAVRWNKKGFYVENLFTIECKEIDDLLAVLEEGIRNRHVSGHAMNEYSSRSHAILTIHITQEQKEVDAKIFLTKHGKLNFVDLAGSEKTKETKCEGKNLIEANNINKSLLTLGTCISALSEPQKRKDGKKKHIPFRDSKLTKLLADSLGGNGITLMVACISPAKSNLSESLCTLRYAARAKKIKTTPIVIMDPRERLIISLKRDVALLRRENGYLKDQLGLDPDEPVKIDEEYKGPPEELINVKGEPKERPRKSRKKTLDDMDKEAMAKLLTEFMTENDALRSENMELYALRDALMRDQEIVCRENERLIQKLEYMHEGGVPSPVEPVRLSSAELVSRSIMNGNYQTPPSTPPNHNDPNANIWTNPMSQSFTSLRMQELKDDHEKRRGSFTRAPPKKGKKSGKVPDKINKELEKRQLKMYSDSEKNILNKLLKRRGGKEKEGGKKQMSASKLNLDLVIDGEGGKGGSEGASASPKKKPKGGRKNSQGHAA